MATKGIVAPALSLVLGMLLALVQLGNLWAADEGALQKQLLAAIKGKDREAAKAIAGKLPTLDFAAGKETPLFRAVDVEDHDMVKFLLAHGAKPDYRAPEDSAASATPLFRAIETVNYAICKELIDAGADIDFRWYPEVNGREAKVVHAMYASSTPLYFALWRENEGIKAIIEYMLTKKPDCSVTFENEAFNGGNILHVANISEYVTPESLKQMIELGADVNQRIVKDNNEFGGFSPICLAASYGISERIAFFAENKADVAVRVTNADYSNATLAMLLLAGHYPTVEGLEILKKSGVDMKAKDDNGNDILFYANQIVADDDAIQKEMIVAKCKEYLAE